MRGFIPAYVLKMNIFSFYFLCDYMIKIYTIESNPRGRPVYKD